VADTGPLVSAVNARERAHPIAARLVSHFGRELVVPVPVAVEADYILRARVGERAARSFLAALSAGEHDVADLSPGLFRRAVEIDRRYADLGLGLTDASVMALAERHHLPILTFDFADFRATAPDEGAWHLVVDEQSLADSLGSD
jgi:predicted nucleic acid-binding protein